MESKGAQNAAKHWGFTENNPTSERTKKWQDAIKEHCEYGVFELEKGENGTPHLQGYFVLNKKKRLSWIKNNMSETAYLFAANGTPDQNYIYCTKDYRAGKVASYFEHGTLPTTGGQKHAEKYKEAIEVAKSQGDIIGAVAPDIALRYYGTLQRIKRRYRPLPDQLSCLRNSLHYGSTGMGKSSYINNRYGSKVYHKNSDKWWCDYVEQEETHGVSTVLIEELDNSNIYLLSWIKKWIDRYPFRAEPKGGSVMIRPPKFDITTNFSLEDICTNKEGILMHKEFYEPLKRRFKHMYNWDVPYSQDCLIDCRPADAWWYTGGKWADKKREDALEAQIVYSLPRWHEASTEELRKKIDETITDLEEAKKSTRKRTASEANLEEMDVDSSATTEELEDDDELYIGPVFGEVDGKSQ